jgi:hypothetical protein
MMRGSICLATVLMLFSTAPTFALGTTEQRANCSDDAFKFCNEHIPDAYSVEKCLRAHLSDLSRACRGEFGGSGKKSKNR